MAPMNPKDAYDIRSEVFDHEVLFLFFQAAASTGSPLPGPDVQDAWPPVEYYQDNPYRCPISSY